jgi:pimeloyl-[acyl-carrier protein] methyl ester esterase
MRGYIFSHGWACCNRVWDPLLSFIPSEPVLFLHRDYFGTSDESLHLSKEISWIGIGHSLGFIRLLQHQFPLQAIIGIQAFTNFLGNNPILNKQRTRFLHNFNKQFSKDPTTTAHSFQKMCGIELHENYINVARLAEDLTLLKASHSFMMPPCLVIGSMDDPIVPNQLILDNFSRNVDVHFFPKGGHNIMQAMPQLLWKQIMDWICSNGV